MTPEKQYEFIVKMLSAFDTATDNTAAPAILKHPEEWTRCPLDFYAAAAELLIDTRAKLDRAAGTSSTRLSAVKRLVKSAMAATNPSLHGITEQDGYFCICDGYRLLRLASDISSLPHYEGPAAPSYKKLIPEVNTHEIPLPALADLKEYIARCKAQGGKNHKISYEVAPGLYVNPEYLFDMMQALPEAVALVDPDRMGKSPIYFKSEDEDGLLLPVSPATAKTL